MNNQLLKESDYLLGWFLFFICTTLCGFIAGAVAGGLIGIVLAVSGVQNVTAFQVAGGIAGFLVSLPISYGFFRLFVGKFIVNKILKGMGVAVGHHVAQPGMPTNFEAVAPVSPPLS